MEKYLLKIKPKHYGVVAFFLTAIAMYLMFAYEEVLSTGRYVILEGDLLQQYIPFIKMFVRDILQGESIWYSWSLSMGMNTSLCYAYYVLSPFNLLFLIFYNVDEAIITAVVLILKTALAALLFQKFAHRVLKCEGIESIVFSVFYAMCSFNVLYNVIIISWMDAIYILPLLCMLIYEFVNEKKWRALLLVYAYLFVTQFYMAYIVGIFSVVFWGIVLVCSDKNTITQYLHKIVSYFAIIGGAIGITAVVWLPSLIFLLSNRQSEFGEVHLRLNILNILGNMFWGQAQGYEGIYPYIYCGIPILFLIPLFFANKEIKKKKKICAVLVFLFLLGSMLIPSLYNFMHAFDEPNQLGFRFAFLWSFVCCVIGCYQCRFFNKKNWRMIIYEIICFIIVYVIVNMLVNNETKTGFLPSYVLLIINILCVLIWGGIYYLIVAERIKKISLSFLILFVTMAEVISNGYVIYRCVGADTLERHYDIYRHSMEQGLEKVQSLDNGTDFYRMRYLNEYVFNSDSWYGYHSISEFNSAINTNLQRTMSKLGFDASSNIIYDVGITPVTKMLFDVRYDIEGVSPYILAIDVPEPKVTINENILNLGYMTDSRILDFEIEGDNVFLNMDETLSTMAGIKINCFDEVIQEEIIIETQNVILDNVDSRIYVLRDVENEEYGYVSYSIPKIERKIAYFQFQGGLSTYASNAPILLGGYENSVYDLGVASASYAKEMTVNADNYEVVMEIRPSDATIAYEQVNISYYNEDELIKAYDILSQNQMVIREYGNTYIDAYVTVPEERTVLFTSIPYDEGWTVYVDGVETQTHAVVGDAFLALELEPGYHDLEFEYEAPGARMGMTISGVSVGLYAGCILIEYMIKRKRKAKEGTIEPDVEDRTE